MKAIDYGFKPVLGPNPKVLILGTMPSVASLNSQQYYGHPRNAFWWIMGQLLGFECTLDYPQRTDFLIQKHIALWDVIASCHRPGSLDSRIDEGTIQVNPLQNLFLSCPHLKLLAFNGQSAFKLFSKHIGLDGFAGEHVVLPSTSPANAATSREEKLAQWAMIRCYLVD